MPAPVQTASARIPSSRSTGEGSVTVQSGETLYRVAARAMGSGARWRDLYEANRAVIGNDPHLLQVGMVLRIPALGGVTPPAAQPAQAPKPGVPTAPKKPSAPTAPTPVGPVGRPGDRDGDGVSDRYDASPDNPRDRRWNEQAAKEYESFVQTQTRKMIGRGVEIDCADFAIKLLSDFCKLVGLPNPMGKQADAFHAYGPGRTGGLPNVKGPNYFLPGLNADNFAKHHTKVVNDANGNGVRGYDRRTGAVDVEDLRPGDVLFYDWDKDGIVNHTVQVVDVSKDGRVTLAFGTYDTVGGGPLTWGALDLQPVSEMVLEPGSAEYRQWLGAGNNLWGVRRGNWMPDKPAA
ncbi:MAG: LysM peptidoglycan-binding domain-containing protein [Candidatus Sericytochromatia bacterium]|nr:LysM peptidoglycan-binding domain-containing protein [Candidatus Sericytochromatia bacterium]